MQIPQDDAVLTNILRGLDECLFNHLRVSADRLEELGQDQLAAAYRWLADNMMVPLRYGLRWHWRVFSEKSLPLSHQLPPDVQVELMDMPDTIGMNWNEAGSMDEAYQRAASALVSSGYLEPLKTVTCSVCKGTGHFDRGNRPTKDRRYRKCGACNGQGTMQEPPF